MRNETNRRNFLSTLAGIVSLMRIAPSLSAIEPARKKRLGVAMTSYGLRGKASGDNKSNPPFKDAIDALDHCHQLGAGGLQIGLRGWSEPFTARVRERRESYGMYLEGMIGLPKQPGDEARFEAEVRTAKEAGASIARTAMLDGRRYESFETAESFRQFADKAWQSLVRAEPIARKHRIRLAIENHKDWRVPELLGILERMSSEYVGLCVDTGNSISLLEDPLEVIKAYAPFAFTTHLKDMAVQEYADGFLLSEVPLGDGFLDLKKIVELLETSRPDIPFNLEMITRDPLKVPCLTEKYWATADRMPAMELAKALGLIRKNVSKKPLPRVTGLNSDEQVAFEEENVRRSFDYARKNLGL